MIKLDKRTNADGTPGTQVRVVEGCPGQGMPTKQRTIRDFGYLENQEYPVAFMARVKEFYRSLVHFAGFEVELQRHLNECVKETIGRDLSYAF